MRPGHALAVAITLAAVALAALVLAAGNAEAEQEGGFIYEVTDDLAIITGYDGPGGEVKIPKALGGYPTSYIATGAFFEEQAITSVTIPYSISFIGQYAFSNCTNLRTVSIGGGTQYVGDYSFEFCSSLEKVVIESGDIGAFAFWRCVSLNDVTLGSGVTSIGNYAFWECISLPTIIIPQSVTSIGTAAFYACGSLIWIEVPDSVVSMGSYVFWECRSMVSAKLGSGLTTIEVGTFCNCASLTDVRLTERVTSIGAFAFNQCSALRSIKMHDNVTSIGQYAFFMCTSLVLVEIGDGVRDIGNDVFSHCTSLEALEIGRSVSSIGIETFSYCTALAYVTVPGSVKTLGSGAFIGCGSLLAVEFEGEVESIGTRAFTYCYSLTSVSFRGLHAPSVDSKWLEQASPTVLGHAFSVSDLPAPGMKFHGLLMGQYLPTIPGPPSSLGFSPGDAEVTVSWSVPGDSGGAPIAGYYLYMASELQGEYALVAASPNMEHTVGGLSNGRQYWFRVSAFNSLGEGGPSVSKASIPGTPSAPMDVAAVSGAGYIQVSWSEPGRLGASRITAYEVYRQSPGTGDLVATLGAATFSWKDMNVTAGGDYAYTVLAVNSFGQGSASAEIAAHYDAVTEPQPDQTWIIILTLAVTLAVGAVLLLARRRR